MSKWVVDAAHSLLEFSVKHMMIASVKGRFAAMEGEIEGDLPDLTTAKIRVSADVQSIDTRDEQRDTHLRSADFFHGEANPKLVFESKRIERTGDDSYKLTGDLSMAGTTKEVTFDATFEGQAKDPWGNERVGLSAQTKINRREWGINFNAALETGGVLVGDQVKVSVELEAVKQAPVEAGAQG